MNALLSVLRWTLLISTILLGSASVVWFVVFAIVGSYEPRYDEDHPDYKRYAHIFSELGRQLPASGSTDVQFVDLAELNQGDWATACIFGGYSDPIKLIQPSGATISKEDEERFAEAGGRGFRLSPIEESEVAIAYIDGQNRAHFIHFRHGIGSRSQWFRKCVAKPETRISFDPSGEPFRIDPVER